MAIRNIRTLGDEILRKGTANYFIVVGIVETVALFTLVFGLLLLG